MGRSSSPSIPDTIIGMGAKVLGLDVGDKRIGVALSDSTATLASPIGTYNRAKAEAESRILELISSEGVELIIVGMPYSEDGKSNKQCAKIMNFCRRLSRRTNVEIAFVDEYLSTQEAKQRLSKQRSDTVDAYAACIILQSYLDQNSRRHVHK